MRALLRLFLVIFPLTFCLPVRSATSRPNIVFILADDLGWTDLGCYGSKYYETPNIDKLAAQGLKFTSGYACGPNCQPTRAALMTGQYGPRTGVYTVGSIDRFNWRNRLLRPVDNVTKLPLNKATVADALKKTGYVTGLFGKWHLGEDAGHHPAQRGFDEAVVTMGRHFDFVTNPKREYPEGTYLADFLTDKAEGFIRRHRDKPFFLYLPHFGVHAPRQARTNLTAKFTAKPAVAGHDDPVYAAMIASVDESVGRIVKLLDDLNLSRNTLVVFSSDNGGVGGYVREGIKKAGDVTDNAPLRGGKGMLTEGGIRVPWIFRWPGKIPKGESDQPITSIDLFPTFLELAEGTPPKDQPLDGVSLMKVLTSARKERLGRDAIYWHFPGYLGAGQNSWRTTPVAAVRSGDWKLLEYFEDNRLELYNLRDDVSEKQNVASKFPARAQDLHSKLVAWRKSMNAPMPAKNPSPPIR
jgi:arylsulfatase A-like enzyme